MPIFAKIFMFNIPFVFQMILVPIPMKHQLRMIQFTELMFKLWVPIYSFSCKKMQWLYMIDGIPHQLLTLPWIPFLKAMEHEKHTIMYDKFCVCITYAWFQLHKFIGIAANANFSFSDKILCHYFIEILSRFLCKIFSSVAEVWGKQSVKSYTCNLDIQNVQKVIHVI